MEAVVTEEVIARQSPEAQAIIPPAAGENCGIGSSDRVLERQGKGKTPQKLLAPPSTQHPTQAASRKPKSEEETRRPAGPTETRAATDPTDQCDEVLPLKPTECPTLWRQTRRRRPRAAAAPGLGLPRSKPIVTEYQRHRLTCPVLLGNDVRGVASRRARGAVGPRLMAFTALLMAYFRQRSGVRPSSSSMAARRTVPRRRCTVKIQTR